MYVFIQNREESEKKEVTLLILITSFKLLSIYQYIMAS